jgi:hypothetical protein
MKKLINNLDIEVYLIVMKMDVGECMIHLPKQLLIDRQVLPNTKLL